MATKEQKEGRKKNSKPWWISPVGVFGEVSFWIAGPVVLAAVLGRHLDRSYGTEPWLLAGCAMLGFLVTSWGIVRTVKKYSAKVNKD